jgi:hypothetical protein
MSIAHYLALFQQTKKVSYLVKATALIVRDGRVIEVLWSLWCFIRHPPDRLRPTNNTESLQRAESLVSSISCRSHCSNLFEDYYFDRQALIQRYGSSYRVDQLPNDFEAARSESIAKIGNSLLIGEYGDRSARLACVTEDACTVVKHYNRMPKVRHIHLVHALNQAGHFLVATGDGRKLLDEWRLEHNSIEFIKRWKKRLAGYTAAATVTGTHYFGTDFSGRPNYIETLDGDRFFFPEPAYTMFPVAFHTVSNKYIIALSSHLNPISDKKAVSVFDCRSRQFVHCKYLST